MKTCPQCAATYEDSFRMCPHDGAMLAAVPSPSDPMVGRVLAGRYRLLEKIGQGGMGSIYKAVQTRMDRICAIKLLTSLSNADEGAVERFNREAKMASRINNPHAVIIYDFGEAEAGMLYLAMEFIDGRPLSHTIARERQLSVARAVDYTNQMVEALSAAHALGIIHRDLKPDNIMIETRADNEEFVKVLDFGIAKAISDDTAEHLTKTGFILGTPVYMSPEQLAGERLDHRSDIYSLAIIVYEMLSGRLPFEGENIQSVMIKRLTSDPIPLLSAKPSISNSVNRVVMSALSRDRDSRPPTARAFASQLSQALNEGTQLMASRPTGTLTSDQENVATVQLSSTPTEVDGQKTSRDQTAPTILVGDSPAESTAPAHSGPAVIAPTEVAPESAAAPSHLSQQVPQSLMDTSSAAAQRTVPEIAIAGTAGRGRSRALLLGGGLAAIVAVSVAIYLLVGGSGGRVTSLVLSGAPAGSEVFVNDATRGVTAGDGTLRIEGLVGNGFKLRVTHVGYADFSTDVSGEGTKDKPITALLLPLELNFNGQMVLIPAGEFTMGDDNHQANEKPAHKVTLPDFYIDKFEATNAKYKEFCQQTGRALPTPEFDPQYVTKCGDCPVVGISWDDAAAFARWEGKRLPREDEWEKAASWDQKAGAKRTWPWGNSAAGGSANLSREEPKFVSVGAYAADVSPYGLMDMAGNAAEWVDAYYLPYEGNSTVDKSFGTKYRVVRGGNCRATLDQARTSHRFNHPWEDTDSQKPKWLVGFRCAVSADDSQLLNQLRAMEK